MLNFIAIIDTENGTRVEPIIQPDADSAMDLAHRLGARFGDVENVILTSFDNFRNEVELAIDSFGEAM